MRAIRAIKPGSASVLKAIDLPDPVPGPGQILVRTAAAGVNYIDVYRRSGVYRVDFPSIPGSEGAGTVAALGSDVDHVAVGDRVAWAHSITGSYAELVLVDADKAIAVPPGLDLQVAAALPLQGMTADYLVRSTHPVGPEDIVLLYAATGGVGHLAAQMILETGARLIAAVGSAAKAQLAAANGIPASDIIVLGTMPNLADDVPAAVRQATGGKLASVVYDSIGKDTFTASLGSLAPRGLLVLFGGSSGQVAPFDLQELNSRGSLFVTRPNLDDYIAAPSELALRSGRVFAAAAAEELKVKIGRIFDLDQASAAHTALESRATSGKVLLVPPNA